MGMTDPGSGTGEEPAVVVRTGDGERRKGFLVGERDRVASSVLWVDASLGEGSLESVLPPSVEGEMRCSELAVGCLPDGLPITVEIRGTLALVESFRSRLTDFMRLTSVESPYVESLSAPLIVVVESDVLISVGAIAGGEAGTTPRFFRRA
jgi:hypothetical protein